MNQDNERLKQDLVVVLLGGDLNCYSVARAFHQAYGVKSVAFGRYLLGTTNRSKIIDFCVAPDINDDDSAVRILRRFAEEN